MSLRSIPLVVLVVAAAHFSGCRPEKPVAAPPATDAEISALMVAFEKSGLSFERNGEIFDNAKAGAWLRLKWSRRADGVRTAEDFIQHVAHHSSETKQPYLIILADGSKVPSAEWFTARLGELRQPK